MASIDGNELNPNDYSTNSSSGTGKASVGDDSYYSDNSMSLDMSGAMLDNSVNIGLQGDDLNSVLGSITAIASQSVSTMQNAVNGMTNQNETLQQIKPFAIYGVIGLGLFAVAKVTKVI